LPIHRVARILGGISISNSVIITFINVRSRPTLICTEYAK